jgi:predicted permease
MTIGELWRRIVYFFNRGRVERELEAEMATHREMMADPRQFGNLLKLREESGDVWGWGWLERGLQDLRYAVRTLRRAPSFSITAVLILSAGIGLNLTFFNLLNVLTLKELPVTDPATLVRLERRGKTFSSSGVPFPATRFIRDNNNVLSAVLTHHPSDFVWEADAASKVRVAFVSANWFDQLGYAAARGRVFVESIDAPAGADPVVIVSDAFWRSRLGSDPQIVGRTVRLNDRAATVIGIAAADFPDLDLQDPQAWVVIDHIDYFQPGSTFKEDWHSNNSAFYARLRPGISPGAAAHGLQSTVAALAAERPAQFAADEWLEVSTAEGRFLSVRDRRKLLQAASLFGSLTLLVLVVASANLANLVLSHAIGRLREFSVRTALGASRWRILRHIVIECGVLAACGAAGGIGLGYASARLFATITELPAYLDFTPDGRLYVAAFAFAVVAMLAFGVVPAWMVSRRDLVRSIKDGGHQASAGLSRARFRLGLVAAQVIGCCALLVVAGAMVRGLQRVIGVSPGFTFAGVALLDASLDRHSPSPEAARAYWMNVSAEVASHPEVAGIAVASAAPFGGAVSQSRYGSDSGPLSITVMRVDPGFFELLGIPILAGRVFGPADDPSSVVISRRVAQRMYGTLDVVGKGYPRSKPTRTIVGVAGDAMVLELRASNSAEEYMPIRPSDYASAVLLARSRTNAAALLDPLYRAARFQDSRIQPSTKLLELEYAKGLRGPRLASAIAAMVALLVLTLACLGVFGVVAYAVKLRTKEIGIRRALGADAPRVYATLLRQLAWPVGIGMFIGTIAGVAASWLLAGEPFHIAVADPAAPTVALIVFALAALAASIVPASRAMKADPLHALRHE